MAHYEYDYSQYTGAARTIVALKDLIDFIGTDKFNLLVLEAKPEKRGYIHCCLKHLLGASGVPVTEFLNMYCGPEQ